LVAGNFLLSLQSCNVVSGGANDGDNGEKGNERSERAVEKHPTNSLLPLDIQRALKKNTEKRKKHF
jgi:hypothetical protein